jgi:hypothetical protein
VSHAVVKLIGATTVRAVLTVNPKLVKMQRWTHVRVSTEERASVNLELHTFDKKQRNAFKVSSAGFVSVYGDQSRDCSFCYSR